MATKHVCDRCESEVDKREEFLILEIRPIIGRTSLLRMEICANCSSAIGRDCRKHNTPGEPGESKRTGTKDNA